jgi:hypothetical protein
VSFLDVPVPIDASPPPTAVDEVDPFPAFAHGSDAMHSGELTVTDRGGDLIP